MTLGVLTPPVFTVLVLGAQQMAGPSLIATQTGAQRFLGPGIQTAVLFVPVSVVSVLGVQTGAQPFLGPGIQIAVPLSLFLW